MRRYMYNYQTIVDFSNPVSHHNILLRCVPMATGCVAIDERHLIISSQFWTQSIKDSFGNYLICGGMDEPHDSLAYTSVGVVTADEYIIPPAGIATEVFLSATPATTLIMDDGISDQGLIEDRAAALCAHAHSLLTYHPQSTDITTTAAQAVELGSGVCQDFAHVMIALCRNHGIAARYANGFVEGIGETHAWVEVFDGFNWIGFDPTHNRRIQYGYIKVAHGRDATDCPVSRGIYVGNANEQTNIIVTLKEI